MEGLLTTNINILFSTAPVVADPCVDLGCESGMVGLGGGHKVVDLGQAGWRT